MKRLFAAVLIMLCSMSTIGHAQAPTGKTQRKSMQGITLSPTQLSQIDALNERYEPRFAALLRDHSRSETSLHRDVRWSKTHALKDARLAELDSILTPTQRAQMHENLQIIAQSKPASWVTRR